MPLDKKRVSDVESLLERLIQFSEKIIALAQKLPKTIVNIPLVQQLVPAATSIGANYNEACEAESSKDFVHKIKISKKEAKESKYWLRLLQTPKGNEAFRQELELLRGEANEYVLIFSSIVSKFKK